MSGPDFKVHDTFGTLTDQGLVNVRHIKQSAMLRLYWRRNVKDPKTAATPAWYVPTMRLRADAPVIIEPGAPKPASVRS
jgi:hypothetical protein